MFPVLPILMSDIQIIIADLIQTNFKAKSHQFQKFVKKSDQVCTE